MTNTHCLLCHSPAIGPLPGYAAKQLLRCRACGFVFCAPIPTSAELLAYYQRYTRDDAISPLTVARYHERLDEFAPYRRTGRLLDVGCGNGHFLHTARQRGWEVFGTEFTDEAVAACRRKGISMYQGPLNPAAYAASSFDVVTSFEVIEHLGNPAEDAAHTATLLRPGGLAYLTTPNFNSLSRRVLGRHWSVIMYPEHLGYFTPATLRRLFESHGFCTDKLLTTGLSPARLVRDMGAWLPQRPAPPATAQELAAPPFRQADEQLRQQSAHSAMLRRGMAAANWLLTRGQLGDTLKGYFVKK